MQSRQGHQEKSDITLARETSDAPWSVNLSQMGVAGEPAFGKSTKFALTFFAVAITALWLLDMGWFYLRRSFPATGKASGSVHRVRLLAISDKGNKTEYQVDAVTPEEDVPCANSLFPHGGENPCWYVVKHAKDPIPM